MSSFFIPMYLPRMLHLELESFIRSHLKLAAVVSDTNPQSSWQLWKYTTAILHQIYTNMDHVSLSPPYTSCLSVRSSILSSYGCYVPQIHFACYAQLVMWDEEFGASMEILHLSEGGIFCVMQRTTVSEIPPEGVLGSIWGIPCHMCHTWGIQVQLSEAPFLIKIPPAPL